MSIEELAKDIHQIAVEHGWHEEERSFGEYIALFHAELSEALEEYRSGKEYNETYYSCSGVPKEGCSNYYDRPRRCAGCKKSKPEGIPTELADTIIRILDFCEQYHIDIGAAIRRKMEYKEGREYKHGGKII